MKPPSHSEAGAQHPGGDFPTRMREAIRAAALRIKESHPESSVMEAAVLAGHSRGKDRSWAITHPEEEVGAEFWPMVQRRVDHEPLAYILGYREFWGRPFSVNPSVLIPRHETEFLVTAALSEPRRFRKVLDVGTGSGCLAVTLALAHEDWEVEASDISPQALAVAQQNSQALGAKVAFHLADLFPQGGPWDLIVSNPPYIGKDESLPKEVGCWEPALALFAEEDGMAIYRRLADEARSHITPGGIMLLELPDGKAADVGVLFLVEGWIISTVLKDLSGTQRVMVLMAPGDSLS